MYVKHQALYWLPFTYIETHQQTQNVALAETRIVKNGSKLSLKPIRKSVSIFSVHVNFKWRPERPSMASSGEQTAIESCNNTIIKWNIGKHLHVPFPINYKASISKLLRNPQSLHYHCIRKERMRPIDALIN